MSRARGSSLTQSRSTPNLPRLASSPAIAVDAGTPRTPRVLAMPSPPHYAGAGGDDGFDDGFDDDEGWEDEEDDDFDLGLHTSSSSSGSASSSPSTASRAPSPDHAPRASASTSPSSPQRRRSSGGGGGSGLLGPAAPPPMLRSQSHHSLSHHSLAAFAPPFYNRPLLPLPPSPSLTSLFRGPSFSATPSRPTTPDDSENDAGPGGGGSGGGAGGGAPPAHSAAAPVPRAAPQVPTYEYYGFALYLTSTAAFALYLLWSFLPSPFLHQLGIHYYPNRWWSLAAPAYLVACVVYVYVALAAYNAEVLTLPLSAKGNFVDEAANVAVLDAKGRIARGRKALGLAADAAAKDHKAARGKVERDRKGGGGRRKDRERRERKARKETRHDGAAACEWDWRAVWSEGTDAVMDVPIGGVCEVLYAS